MALPPSKPGKYAPPNKAPLPSNEPEPDALARSKREREELTLEVKDTEEELERVRARYDQFFLGLERREPAREREAIRKRVMVLKEAFTRNAGLKFRLQTLHARYLTYERLWMRSAREKEEGTYRRDVLKARLRAKGKSTPNGRAPSPASAGPGVVKPVAAAPVTTGEVQREASSAPSALSDSKMKALFESYVDAKRRCGEDVANLSYESVAKSVKTRIPELMAQYKAKSVDFRVEIKNGRAALIAIPKG